MGKRFVFYALGLAVCGALGFTLMALIMGRSAPAPPTADATGSSATAPIPTDKNNPFSLTEPPEAPKAADLKRDLKLPDDPVPAKENDIGPVVADALRACGDASNPQIYECQYRAWAPAIMPDRDGTAKRLTVVDKVAERIGGPVPLHCHVVMHRIGREWVTYNRIGIGDLPDRMPTSNNPLCAAGFTHGMMMALGANIHAQGAKKTSRLCDGRPTRFQGHSCYHGLGHVYTRLFADMPKSIAACDELGVYAGECSQGIFHDYWLAYEDIDGAPTTLVTDKKETPEKLCGRQPARHWNTCWQRYHQAWTAEKRLETPAQMLRACSRVTGAQRQACLYGLASNTDGDPLKQLGLCAQLTDRADQRSCAMGVGWHFFNARPLSEALSMIGSCSVLRADLQDECVQEFSRRIIVGTEGDFRTKGCPLLPARQRALCQAAARPAEIAKPLV